MQHLLFVLAAFLQVCATRKTGPFSVRLSGSPNLCIGRVEVFHQGKWGTVCDDEWDMLDATVVCQELNCGEALSALHGAWFGEGTGPIWLNEVRCTGTERHLHACRHKGFRRHVCTHEEDASVICSDQRFPPFNTFSPPPTVKGDKMEAVTATRPAPSVLPEGSPALRLIGGRSRCSGRVEVFHQGRWGTVCDDMWELSDVTVVCRELGCGEALAAPDGALFGEGNDVIWLDDVQCHGGESTLAECHSNPWGTHNCRHNEDAGAVCSDEMPLTMTEEHLVTLAMAPQRHYPKAPRRSPRPTLPTRDQAASVAHEASRRILKSSTEGHSEAIQAGQWQVRLAGGSRSCAGRVEVLHKDSWGTVCDDGWDMLDAAVVCRELGCGSPLLSPGNARYGPGSGPIWLDDVNCTGKESSLQHCQSQPRGQHNCNHHEDASVICTDMWKPLAQPKRATDSYTAESILTRQGPTPADESGLQTTLDMVEDTTQGLPHAWEMESTLPEELFPPPTHGMEPEVKEEEPTSPWNIQETTPSQEDLQDVNDIESPSFLRTRSPTHPHRLEPADPSIKSQPLSTMRDLESDRETEPRSPPGIVMLKQSLTGTVDSESSIQWDDMSREPSVTPKPEPSSSSPEAQPASAVWVVKAGRDIEPTTFPGTELPPVIKDLTDTMEMVTEVQWDDTTKVPPVKQGTTNPSAETQPASDMWGLESERETDSSSPPGTVTFRQDLKPALETVSPIQWDNMSRESPVTQKAEASNSSVETQPSTAMWVVESERETEPTNFSGTELFPDTQVATETVTQVQWDDTPGLPPVTQEPTNIFAETQPSSDMWVWESEREMESVSHGGMEVFPSSESLEATREMQMSIATQNIQPINDREETSPEFPDSKGDEERLDEDPHTVKSIAATESTIILNTLSPWDGTDVSGVNDALSQSPVLHTFDIDGPSEKDMSSEVTERESDTVSTPGQTKAPGPSIPSAEPVIPTAQLNEASAGCPVRQEPRKEHQDCCYPPDTLGNMVRAMDGLRGELGSLSTAIQQQGSQLEAVAHSLVELATSVHQLVKALPALMQPALARPSSVPCRQKEGEIQNQLPVK